MKQKDTEGISKKRSCCHRDMYNRSKDLYMPLTEYLSELVKDRTVAVRIIEVFILAEIPLQSFVKTMNLYKKIFIKSMLLADIPTESKGDHLDLRASYSNKKLKENVVNRRIRAINSISPKDLQNYLGDTYLIVIVCCIISCKYFRDVSFTNDSWEQLTQIDLNTLNKAERISLIILEHILDYSDEKEEMENVNEVLVRNRFCYMNNLEDESIYGISKKKFKFFLKRLFCMKK